MSHKAAKVDCSLLLIDLYKWNTRIPECSSIIHAFINMEIHSRASPRNAALGGSDISGDLRSSSASWAWSRDMNTLLCTDSLLVGLTIGGQHCVSSEWSHTDPCLDPGSALVQSHYTGLREAKDMPVMSWYWDVSRVCAASEFLGMICFAFPRSLYGQNPWWSPKRSGLSVLWNLFKSFTCCEVLGERF